MPVVRDSKTALADLLQELSELVRGAKPEGGPVAFLPPVLDMIGDFASVSDPKETASLCWAASSAVRRVLKQYRGT